MFTSVAMSVRTSYTMTTFCQNDDQRTYLSIKSEDFKYLP